MQPVPTVLKRGRAGVGLEAAAVEAAGVAAGRARRNWDAPYAERGDAGPGGVKKVSSSAAAQAAAVALAAAAVVAPRITHFKANDAAAVATFRPELSRAQQHEQEQQLLQQHYQARHEEQQLLASGQREGKGTGKGEAGREGDSSSRSSRGGGGQRPKQAPHHLPRNAGGKHQRQPKQQRPAHLEAAARRKDRAIRHMLSDYEYPAPDA